MVPPLHAKRAGHSMPKCQKHEAIHKNTDGRGAFHRGSIVASQQQ
jgi:hypothetical protein